MEESPTYLSQTLTHLRKTCCIWIQSTPYRTQTCSRTTTQGQDLVGVIKGQSYFTVIPMEVGVNYSGDRHDRVCHVVLCEFVILVERDQDVEL